MNKSEFWSKTNHLFLDVGYIFCLGGIFSFIVMNIVLGKTPSIDAVYWQRLFVSKITDVLVIPGICLILASTVAFGWKYGFRGNIWIIVVETLVVLIVINSINITILEGKATAMAIQQKETMRLIPEYLTTKGKEDIFGGINMLMLLTTFIVLNYKLKK